MSNLIGAPEKIPLKGHDEYSIKISYLQKIAEAFGYTSFRGPFADFIPFTITDKVQYALASQECGGDEDEIICQFIEDLYKYEYLILKNVNNIVSF